jgi:hypothetical protein
MGAAEYSGPYVLFRLPDGTETLLRPGDRIGRHLRCELQIADSRVSEMHAVVSVRGRGLTLLGLRGGLAIDGRVVQDPFLEVGQTVEVAPGLGLQVRELHLPHECLAIAGPGIEPTVLTGTTSVFTAAPAELRPGFHPRSDAMLYTDGEHWFCEVDGVRRGPLAPGPLQIGDWSGELRLDAVPTAPRTMDRSPRAPESLRIEAWVDQVRVFGGAVLKVHLNGKKAQIVYELAAVGVPIAWEAIAREVWPDVDDRYLARKRWDTTLGRTRRALSDASVRPDLLLTDGRGLVSLCLYPTDEVVLHD